MPTVWNQLAEYVLYVCVLLAGAAPLGKVAGSHGKQLSMRLTPLSNASSRLAGSLIDSSKFAPLGCWLRVLQCHMQRTATVTSSLEQSDRMAQSLKHRMFAALLHMG